MPRLAILGSYPEGPESTNYDEYSNMRSPWKRNESSPFKVWADAEPAIRRTIMEFGSINIYVHFGQGAPVALVLSVKDIDARPSMFRPNAPIFPSISPDEQAHVWIQYKAARELKKPFDPRQQTERLIGNGMFDVSRPVDQASWHRMFTTGLFFIEDPLAK